MNREKKTLETTGGHKVEVLEYLTGREVNEVKRKTYGKVTADVGTPGEKHATKMPLSLMIEREEAILEAMVVSFDGSTENACDKLKDLPQKEYQEVVKRILSEAGDF